MKSTTILIIVPGIRSRFENSIKQLVSVVFNDDMLMGYSIYIALATEFK